MACRRRHLRARSQPGIFHITLRGFFFSLDAMWTEVSALNLLKAAPTLQMPVFLFVERHDHWVAPGISVAYFAVLGAPSKRLVWFEESGQEPFVDEAARFNAEMVELVRPVVTASNQRSCASAATSPAPPSPDTSP